MMNINIINKLIKGISEQLPLVNSYYTVSPYDSWNVVDVKYGSVSFVVTKTTTQRQTTAYDCVLYYADRLTEDKSNRDSIHSDAATVIQTIVGALNQSNEEYIMVDYPVGITLFEQSFCDDLAGGYANMVITVEGMGECFNDEFAVPEIVGTSAYYTKDEIIELFPLKTTLARIATSGSFNDLLDVPDLVNKQQYNNLIESVLKGLRTLSSEVQNRVSVGCFDGWADNVDKQLSNKVNTQQYNNLIESTTEGFTILANEVKNRVSVGYFNEWSNNVESLLKDTITTHLFKQFADGQNTININLAKEIYNKVNTAQFDDTVKDITTRLDKCATIQEFEDYISSKEFTDFVASKLDVYSKTEVDSLLSNIQLDDYYTKTEVDNIIANIGGVAPSGESIPYVVITAKYLGYPPTVMAGDLNAALTALINNQPHEIYFYNQNSNYGYNGMVYKMQSYYFWTSSNEGNMYYHTEVGTTHSDISVKFTYDTTTETFALQSVGYLQHNYLTSVPAQYITETELSNELSSYYTKTQIDDTIGNIDNILNNVLYTL